jgi:Protein of unknown function with HXXEE motif
MALLRRHWYNLGGWIALGTIIYLAIERRRIDVSSALLLMNFVALLFHQFEEYGWPGGEPAIMNMVLQPSDKPDRYPLNQNSAMVVNVLAAYGFYLLPVFFPHVYWLGIGPTFFGFGQFIVHGIVTPKKLGSFYNPGLAAVVFLHFPIGIAYLYHIVSLGSVRVTDWFFGAVYMVAFVAITLRKMTYGWLASKASPYPFAPEEMQRFNVIGKLARRKQR